MAQAAKSPPAATGHSLPSVRAEEHCRHDTGVGPPDGVGLKLAVMWRLTIYLRFMNARFQACPGKRARMKRNGVRQVPDGSGEQGKMEKTGCKIICGAPTTLAVK